MSAFAKWIDTFLDEKEVDTDYAFDIETPGKAWEHHMIPVNCVVEIAKGVSPSEQLIIKNQLVLLDFANAPILPYLRHLAQALAEAI